MTKIASTVGPTRNFFLSERTYARHGSSFYDFERIISIGPTVDGDPAYSIVTVTARRGGKVVHRWTSRKLVAWQLGQYEEGPGWYDL